MAKRGSIVLILFVAMTAAAPLFAASPPEAAKKKPRFKLTLAAKHGTILQLPEGDSFPAGTTVTLSPIADSDYRFARWSGDLPTYFDSAHPSGLLTVTLDADRSLEAHFAKEIKRLPPPDGLQVFPRRREMFLTWKDVESPRLVGYHVYARPAGEPVWSRLTERPTTKTRFTDNELFDIDEWEYDVTAVDTSGTETLHPIYADSLAQLIDGLATTAPAPIGIYCLHLETGEEAGVRPDERFPAMSAIKVALAAYVHSRARAKPGLLDKTVVLRKEDQVKGSGGLRYRKPGGKLQLRELLRLMLADSDNTAANMLVDAMGGLKKVNDGLAKMGFPKLMILKKALIDNGENPYPKLRKKFQFSTITPREQGDLFRRLALGKAVDPKSDQTILKILRESRRGSGLKHYISWRPGVQVANKTGSSNHNRLDSGLITTVDRGNWILVIALRDYPKVIWADSHPCVEYIADVSWEVYEYFGAAYGLPPSQ